MSSSAEAHANAGTQHAIVSTAIRLARNCIGLDVSPKERTEKVVLPADPVRLTIHQRNKATIPGSKGQIKIHLGDITGGQVMLSVTKADEGLLVEPHSVHTGDVIQVQLGDEELYIKVVRLRNFLLGDDFGEVVVSKSQLEPGISSSQDSQHALPETDEPQQFQVVAQQLKAVSDREMALFRQAYSKRMQHQIEELHTWDEVLEQYRRSLSNAFGDWKPDDFSFQYEQTTADSGKVLFIFRGEKPEVDVALRVVREEGAWKVDEM